MVKVYCDMCGEAKKVNYFWDRNEVYSLDICDDCVKKIKKGFYKNEKHKKIFGRQQ